jgi:hypothetical protein
MGGLALTWLLRGGWKYLAVIAFILAIVAGVHRYGKTQYNHGVDDMAAKWAASEVKAAAVALTLAQERQSAVDRASVAEASAQRSVELLAARGRDTVKEYYRANPADNRDCLTADRLRAIAASDTAAYAAATPSGKRADTMRNPPD